MKENHVFYVLVVVAVVTLTLLLKAGKNKPGHAQTEKTGNNECVRDDADMAPVRTGEVGASPSQSLSTSVLTLIDTDADYETRLDAMSKLGYEISTNDVAALMNFLVAEIPADVKISRGAYNSVRNDLYEVLLRQKEMPEGMGNLLIDVVNNPDQDGMWRNYCIQFMPEFYAKAKRVEANRAGVNAAAVDDELKNVQESL